MKKITGIVAVIAVVAIIFAVVFGVQKGNLQTEMKKASDEAATMLAN